MPTSNTTSETFKLTFGAWMTNALEHSRKHARSAKSMGSSWPRLGPTSVLHLTKPAAKGDEGQQRGRSCRWVQARFCMNESKVPAMLTLVNTPLRKLLICSHRMLVNSTFMALTEGTWAGSCGAQFGTMMGLHLVRPET